MTSCTSEHCIHVHVMYIIHVRKVIVQFVMEKKRDRLCIIVQVSLLTNSHIPIRWPLIKCLHFPHKMISRKKTNSQFRYRERTYSLITECFLYTENKKGITTYNYNIKTNIYIHII